MGATSASNNVASGGGPSREPSTTALLAAGALALLACAAATHYRCRTSSASAVAGGLRAAKACADIVSVHRGRSVHPARPACDIAILINVSSTCHRPGAPSPSPAPPGCIHRYDSARGGGNIVIASAGATSPRHHRGSGDDCQCTSVLQTPPGRPAFPGAPATTRGWEDHGHRLLLIHNAFGHSPSTKRRQRPRPVPNVKFGDDGTAGKLGHPQEGHVRRAVLRVHRPRGPRLPASSSVGEIAACS